ncbi:MAG: c-type cytochrome [Acidobacteria bacterium]|nr:c-type cytochrome [Acidobacteriota bacterium]
MTRRTSIGIVFVAVATCAVWLFTISSQANVPAKIVTFSKDVAPIFNKNCATCHRPGEAAPFSTLSYQDVRPWAKSIKEKVANRVMPPWHHDPHIGQWSNDARLSQADIDTVVAWVNAGAPEGNAKDLPPVPQFTNGWSIGKPDLIIPMPKEYVLKPNGPDEIQLFEVDPGFKQDVYVQMAEARPGNRKIVHHIIAFVQPPQKANDDAKKMTPEERRQMREQMNDKMVFFQDGFLTKVKADAPVYDDGCATPSGGGGTFRDGSGSDGGGSALLAGYAPGMNQAKWPAGTVKKIPAGSKLIFQLHYSTFLGVTSEERDKSSVGLVFAKNTERELKTEGIANHYFKIPAGAENHRATACWTAPEDLHIVTFMPHLHMRGKSMEFKAVYPDGRSEIISNVPKYDFNWQIVYYAKNPIAIPKGTRVIVTTTWDNSTKNKFNPDPKKDIRWGDPTYEEMTIGWIDYTLDKQSLKGVTASTGSSSK